MASEVQICNLALSHLGSYTISALTEATQEARQCNLLYDPVRDAVLRDFPWNFAERRGYLAELSGVTPVGYDYAYAYPTDCIKARHIYNAVAGAKPIDFIVNAGSGLASKMILTDEADAILIYTAKITDPNMFDASFVNAMAYKLASDLALPLTKKASLQNIMLQIYARYMSMAYTTNATEAKDTAERDNPFTAARE